MKFSEFGRSKRVAAITHDVALLAIILAYSFVVCDERHTLPPAPVFLCVTIFCCWLGGYRTGIAAAIVSILCFDYFILPPQLSLAIIPGERAHFFLFSLTAIIACGITCAQKRAMMAARRTRDELANTVLKLEQANTALTRINTEQAEVHERLRYSEAFLVEGQKISHTGSWRWNCLSGTITWSDEHYRIFGYLPDCGLTPAEIFQETIHEEDAAYLRDIAAAAMRRHERFECEYKIVLADGAVRHVRGVGCPVPGDSSAVGEYIGVTVDITTLKQTEGRLMRTQCLLRNLADRTETVREEERKHLARELHDDLAQHLLALRMKISLFNLEFGQAQAGLAQRTGAMIELIDANMKILRNIITALRPPVLDIGIVSALEWLVDDFNAQRKGITCRLHQAAENLVLDERSAIAIFRIAQESLRNVARHAEADEVTVVFEHKGDACLLKIKDNGKGFDPAAVGAARNSFGLIGIQERVLMLEGKVDIASSPGQGTLIRVSIPTISACPEE